MGKIRVRTIGDEASEVEEQKKKAAKREQKKLAKEAESKTEEVKVEAVVPVAKNEAKEVKTEEKVEEAQVEDKKEEAPKATKSKKEKFLKKKELSKRYASNATLVNKEKKYKLTEAVETLKKFKPSKFDETVELHINTKEKGISGQVMLPHGTGKKLRVVIADDDVIAQVEKGKIEFDVLVAHPSMMPKLAKIARVLGPKGLMPNPKAGTVSPNPEDAVKKLSAGQVNFKTESVAPVIHMSVGKVSFEDSKLKENIKMAISTIGTAKINSVILKSTMSPAVRVDFSEVK